MFKIVIGCYLANKILSLSVRLQTFWTPLVHQIVGVRCLWPWVARPTYDGVVRDKLWTSGFVDDVMFVHNGQARATRKGHIQWRMLKVTYQEIAQGRRLISTIVFCCLRSKCYLQQLYRKTLWKKLLHNITKVLLFYYIERYRQMH